ncbi:DUF4910 domain-containing protein [Oscillatoria sp. FACHB-1406]|nr:DUF4910 domain-containing protein [Oscillatoria sp. FACHB-1406]
MTIEPSSIGQDLYDLIVKLYPICRSITGGGTRQTLQILKESIPLEVREVPTGTQVFDWIVPKEWNIKDAYIKNARGEKIVDFAVSSLHILNYSLPVRTKLELEELKPHLFTLSDSPDWIPYRTSYYKENWGFCLAHNQYLQLEAGEYEVFIDSSLEPGYLTYGEYYLPGESEEEVLISCHICHPSLANDNLSGNAIATFLAQYLRETSRRYSYRFLFIPGTIGSITWLSLNEDKIANIKHGLVLTCLGDSGHFTYKKSRRGNAEIDRIIAHLLATSSKEYEMIDFYPYGYDERQYCSPGFNLPVGCLMRSRHGTFPEYHTSADNLDFIKPESLAESFALCRSIVDALEANKTYLNQNPKCEPQLGKRGLYRTMGGHQDSGFNEMALLWVLNLSDGKNSLLDIAERSQIPFEVIAAATRALCECKLLVDSSIISEL